MRKHIKPSLAILFSLFIVGCASSNPDTTADAAVSSDGAVNTEEQAVAARDPEKVRCKTYAETGSRIGKKVCKTNARWEEDARASREAAESIQRDALQAGVEGG